MVKVYIWLPDCSNKMTIYGHAALKMTSVDDGYISFYPAKEGKKWNKDIKRIIGTKAAFSDSLKEDKHYLEKKHDHKIEIYNLNEDAMEEYWLDIKKNERKFSLLYQNCSAVVGRALITGFTEIQVETFSDFKKALKFMRLYLPSNFHGLKKAIQGEISFWTPRKVLEFAEVLSRVSK